MPQHRITPGLTTGSPSGPLWSGKFPSSEVGDAGYYGTSTLPNDLRSSPLGVIFRGMSERSSSEVTLMGKAAWPEFQRSKPAVSRMGSWMLVCSAAVLVVSLMLPWFGGRVSISYIQYYGFEIGFALFCTAIVVTSIGLGIWCSWIGRARSVLWLSLAASIVTVLFAGFTLVLSSTVGRVASIAGLSDVVGVRVRPGLPTLLVGGLLGIAGSVTVLVRSGARSDSTAVETAPVRESRWTTDSGNAHSQQHEDELDSALDSASHLPTHDEDYW